ncbi:MAG: C40 family peptidase [Bacilli bacterium]|nr:C40 family peptidase [Bacilli bacterium]
MGKATIIKPKLNIPTQLKINKAAPKNNLNNILPNIMDFNPNNNEDFIGPVLEENIDEDFIGPPAPANNNYKKTEEKSILPEMGKIQGDFNRDIDLEPYKIRMEEIIGNSKNQREIVTNLAIFISSEFPKLPYCLDYSSGHDGASLKGLDWTKEIIQREDGSYNERTLDCSGLVTWCMENAGIEIEEPANTTTYRNMVGEENISAFIGNDLENVKPGDLAFNPNGYQHIGVIASVNKENHEITVVHTSGSGGGVNITTLNTDTGKITSDDTGSTGINRVGQENYFTEIFHVPYKDE